MNLNANHACQAVKWIWITAKMVSRKRVNLLHSLTTRWQRHQSFPSSVHLVSPLQLPLIDSSISKSLSGPTGAVTLDEFRCCILVSKGKRKKSTDIGSTESGQRCSHEIFPQPAREARHDMWRQPNAHGSNIYLNSIIRHYNLQLPVDKMLLLHWYTPAQEQCHDLSEDSDDRPCSLLWLSSQFNCEII